jgi:hypothetical protein
LLIQPSTIVMLSEVEASRYFGHRRYQGREQRFFDFASLRSE